MHSIRYWSLGAAAVALAACAGAPIEPSTDGEPPSGTGPAPGVVASLSIRDTALLVDEALAMPVTARDARGQPITNPAIEWRSSAPTVAAVDDSGRVTALAMGTAVLTAAAGTIEARATITVAPQFTQLATGEMHTCGITGRAEVYCWGASIRGELGPAVGLEDCSARFGPGFRCSAVPVRSSSLRAAAITAGAMHTCALDRDGIAYCWGANFYGETGTGSQTDEWWPARVASADAFVQIVAGRMHTCGITVARNAYCWGRDWTGALGAGSVSSERCAFFGTDPCSRTPRPVAGDHRWAQLAASDRATCGVTVASELYCWGLEVGGDDGLYCQTPDNLAGCTRTPTRVPSTQLFRAAAVGDVHQCAQMLDGTLACWGANYWGAFGNGTVIPSRTPVPAAGSAPYASFVSTRSGACALGIDGRARCWGLGNDGQIGNGMMQNALSPAAVRGDHRFVSLAASGSSDVVCGITLTGRAYCWGQGRFGQLGNGSFLSSSEPVLVRLVGASSSTVASPIATR